MVETPENLYKLLKVYRWMNRNKRSITLRKMEGFLSDLGCTLEEITGNHDEYTHVLLKEAPIRLFNPRIVAEQEKRFIINLHKNLKHDAMTEWNVGKILEKVKVIFLMWGVKKDDL